MNQNPDFIRDLHVLADGQENAQGYRMILTARESLTLLPALYRLEIHDLSESSAAMLSGSKRLEVVSGISVLSAGEISEVCTRRIEGKRITTVIFSPGLSLWQSSVSLSLAAGMKVSDSIRELLAAACLPNSAASNQSAAAISQPSASGTQPAASASTIPLAAFTADDPVLSRPQAFFGRTCDALSLLAETADADAFVGSAGVCISGRNQKEPMYAFPESDLLSAPVRIGSQALITIPMISCMPGTVIRATWKGADLTGRVISRLIQADNVSGPWKSELEVDLF